MTEPDPRLHSSAWKASLDSGLVQRLNRPLAQSGIINRQMANAIINRADPLHNRLPLMDQQMQRWARVIDLETPPLAIVYAQPPGQYPPGQPDLAALPGVSSLSVDPANASPAPTQFPLVQAQWVLAKDAEIIGQPFPEPFPAVVQTPQTPQISQTPQTKAQQAVVGTAPLSAASVNEAWNQGAASLDMPRLVPPSFTPISPDPITAIGVKPSPTMPGQPDQLGQPDQRSSTSNTPPQTETRPRPIRAVPVAHHPDSPADNQLPRVSPLPDSSQMVVQMKSMPIVHVNADQALPQTLPSTTVFQANRESGGSQLSPDVQSIQSPSSNSANEPINKPINTPINKLTNEVLNHPTTLYNDPKLFLGGERGERNVLRDTPPIISTGLLYQPPTITPKINSQAPLPFQPPEFEKASPEISLVPSSNPPNSEALPRVANITYSQAILQPSLRPFEYTFLPGVQPTQPIAISSLDHKTDHQSEQLTKHQSEIRTKPKSGKNPTQRSENHTQHRSANKTETQSELITQNKSGKKTSKSRKKSAPGSGESPESQSSAERSRAGKPRTDKQYRSSQGKESSQGKGLQPTATGLAIPAQVRSLPRGFAPLQRKATQSATQRVSPQLSSTPLPQAEHLSASNPTTMSSPRSQAFAAALLSLPHGMASAKTPIEPPVVASIRGDESEFSWNSAVFEWPSTRTVEPLPLRHAEDSVAPMGTANPVSWPLQRKSSPASPITPTLASATDPTSIDRSVPGWEQSATPLTWLLSGNTSFETQTSPPQFSSYSQSPVNHRVPVGLRSHEHPTPSTYPPTQPNPKDLQTKDPQTNPLSRVQPQTIPQAPFERFEYKTLWIESPPHLLDQPVLNQPGIGQQSLGQTAHHFADTAYPTGVAHSDLPIVNPFTPASPYHQPPYPQGETPLILNPLSSIAFPASQNQVGLLQAKQTTALNSPSHSSTKGEVVQPLRYSPPDTPLVLNLLSSVTSPESENQTDSIHANASSVLNDPSYRSVVHPWAKADSLPPPQSLMPELLLVQPSRVDSESGLNAGAIAPAPPTAKRPKKSPEKQPTPPSPTTPSLHSPKPLPTVQVSPKAAITDFEPLVLPATLKGALQDTQSHSHTTPQPTTAAVPSLSTRSQSLSPAPTIHPVQMQPAIAEPPPAPPIDIETLVDKVERRLMKRLVIESERRGQKKWH